MDPMMIENATKLTELTFNRGMDWIANKTSNAKTIKDNQELHNYYNEMFNQLLDDKSQLIQIASGYKTALEARELNDSDLAQVKNTVEKVLDIFVEYNQLNGDETEANDFKDSVQIFLDLINADTLKTMQVLGFDYREAIGKALTLSIQNRIFSSVTSKNGSQNNEQEQEN